MSNPIRPSDCPSVLGVHAHFHVSDYSLLDNETKEGKRAPKGTARVRGALTAPEAHIARLASRGA